MRFLCRWLILRLPILDVFEDVLLGGLDIREDVRLIFIMEKYLGMFTHIHFGLKTICEGRWRNFFRIRVFHLRRVRIVRKGPGIFLLRELFDLKWVLVVDSLLVYFWLF